MKRVHLQADPMAVESRTRKRPRGCMEHVRGLA
jgi:hypothetical protein